MDTIISYLEKNLQDSHATWRFSTQDREFHLLQLNTLSARYAMVLHKLGVGPADRVALLLDYSSDYVGLLLAIWRLNAVAVPLGQENSEPTGHHEHILACDDLCDFKILVYRDKGNEQAFSYWHNNREKFAVPLSNLQEIKTTPMNNAIFNYRHAKEDDLSLMLFSAFSVDKSSVLAVTHAMVMSCLQDMLRYYELSHHGSSESTVSASIPVNYELQLFTRILMPVYIGCINQHLPEKHNSTDSKFSFKELETHSIRDEIISAVAV